MVYPSPFKLHHSTTILGSDKFDTSAPNDTKMTLKNIRSEIAHICLTTEARTTSLALLTQSGRTNNVCMYVLERLNHVLLPQPQQGCPASRKVSSTE